MKTAGLLWEESSLKAARFFIPLGDRARHINSHNHTRQKGGSMKRLLYAKLFFLMLVFLSSSPAWAVLVNVDTGAYLGRWWSNTTGTNHYGPATLDLPAGTHTIKPTWETWFTISVTEDGFVDVLNTGPAQGGQNSLTFNTVPVNIDVDTYLGNYFIDANNNWLTSSQTVQVVPVTAGAYSLHFQWSGYGGSAPRFTVDANGIPRVSPGWEEALAVTGNTISVTTAPVTFDPGQYLGSLRLYTAAKNLNSGGTFTGVQTLDLPVGIKYALGVGSTGENLHFELAPDGTVTSLNPDSATGGQNTFTLITEPVFVDPSEFVGRWFITKVSSGYTGGEKATVNLVPGLTYNLVAAADSFNFDLAAGGVVTVENGVSATGGQNTLTLITEPVFVDPGAFMGRWYISNGSSGYTGGESATVNLIPGLTYKAVAAADFINFDLAADGVVTVENGVSATGGQNVLTYNTTHVSVDPNGYLGAWYIANGMVGSHSGGEIKTVALVPGLGYDLIASSYRGKFHVFDPCGVVPEGLSFGIAPDDITFNFICELPSIDTDQDEIPDDSDNCPYTPNHDQLDQDLDGSGDLCDDDDDNDGVLDTSDNCQFIANEDQADLDGDFVGDVCDNDDDNDGVEDEVDNCLDVVNTDQADSDQDSAGDACDSDDDNDGIEDGVDNCPFIENSDQADFDNDGEGNVCDGDVDADGVVNELDACPNTPFGTSVNIEGCNGPQFIAQQCSEEDHVIHGHYVKCVAHAANEAVSLSILSKEEKSRFVREAAKK